jgi:hypothetical protein
VLGFESEPNNSAMAATLLGAVHFYVLTQMAGIGEIQNIVSGRT